MNYDLETRLEADTQLIKNRLYLGLNLLYEPETTRADLGVWENESTLGVSSALAFQIIPKVTIGADLWYLSHYDGAVFNSFTGGAVYLGPTFYWHITPKILMSAAWIMCLSLHVMDPRPRPRNGLIANHKVIAGSVMTYLSNVVNERPMVRVSASVIFAFCCAAPLVWLFSNLVVYGLRSFL